jgi:hypothetical protein
MKLRTVQEIGNFTDADMSIYEKVKSIKRNRNTKDLIYRAYDLPLFIGILFSSIAISFVISLFLLLNILNAYSPVSFSLSLNDVVLALSTLFILSMIPIFVFYLLLWSFAINKHYSKQDKAIEKEIYKEL